MPPWEITLITASCQLLTYVGSGAAIIRISWTTAQWKRSLPHSADLKESETHGGESLEQAPVSADLGGENFDIIRASRTLCLGAKGMAGDAGASVERTYPATRNCGGTFR